MDVNERRNLITRMGSDAGSACLASERGEWPMARMYLNRLIAGVGMLAMEIDDADPVEREN